MTANNNDKITVSYIGDLARSISDDIFLVESDEDYVRVCAELSRKTKPIYNLFSTKRQLAWYWLINGTSGSRIGLVTK